MRYAEPSLPPFPRLGSSQPPLPLARDNPPCFGDMEKATAENKRCRRAAPAGRRRRSVPLTKQPPSLLQQKTGSSSASAASAAAEPSYTVLPPGSSMAEPSYVPPPMGAVPKGSARRTLIRHAALRAKKPLPPHSAAGSTFGLPPGSSVSDPKYSFSLRDPVYSVDPGPK